LVARNSVSTVPPATLDILLDSNTVLLPFGTKVDFVSGAREILDETGRALSDVGSSLDDVFLDLENEGLMQFEEAYISLLAALQSKYL
jgi:transaldolase